MQVCRRWARSSCGVLGYRRDRYLIQSGVVKQTRDPEFDLPISMGLFVRSYSTTENFNGSRIGMIIDGLYPMVWTAVLSIDSRFLHPESAGVFVLCLRLMPIGVNPFGWVSPGT